MEEWDNKDTGRLPAVDGTDGREALPKFWIAVYTRPRSEKKAAKELSRHSIETFVPVQSVTRQWSDRKKKVDVVVIPNIIFIYLSENELLKVKTHPLILRILTYPGNKSYGIIPDAQIESLKYMLIESDSPVEFCQSIDYKTTKWVKVKQGNLKGLVGAVEKLTTNKSRLIVMLDILGGAMVEIDTSDLEVIKEDGRTPQK